MSLSLGSSEIMNTCTLRSVADPTTITYAQTFAKFSAAVNVRAHVLNIIRGCSFVLAKPTTSRRLRI